MVRQADEIIDRGHRDHGNSPSTIRACTCKSQALSLASRRNKNRMTLSGFASPNRMGLGLGFSLTGLKCRSLGRYSSSVSGLSLVILRWCVIKSRSPQPLNPEPWTLPQAPSSQAWIPNPKALTLEDVCPPCVHHEDENWHCFALGLKFGTSAGSPKIRNTLNPTCGRKKTYLYLRVLITPIYIYIYIYIYISVCVYTYRHTHTYIYR